MTEEILDKTEEIQEKGEIKIAQDVIATIAGMSAAGVKGVAGMSGGITGGIAEMLGRKQLTKGVKVDGSAEGILIDVFLIVDYGSHISNVAKEVQEAVKEAVENMTGKKVISVNVTVQGIAFPKEETAKEAEVEVEEEKVEE